MFESLFYPIDDSYWWDSTTDSFAPRSHSSSSTEVPRGGSDHMPISDESSEFSANFGTILERISEKYEPKFTRIMTPQPRKLSEGPGSHSSFTPQPIRRACSQMEEPYSPHPRRRFRSFNCGRRQFGYDYEHLQMAVSDMQVNIAPKLANFLSRSADGSQSKCSDENHTVIVDSLKLVYKGIQTICSALLDEDQFKQPNFNFQGSKVAVENGMQDRCESRDSKTPDDEYFDQDVMNVNRLGGRLWGANTPKNGRETEL